MNYSYKKIYDKNFLVLDEFNNENKTKDYSIEMLKHNSINGLLSMQLLMEDNIPSYHYDITYKQSFHSYFYNNTIKKKHIVSFFTSLHNTLLNLKKYLLDYNHLVFTPQCIFFDRDLSTFYFTYCPSHTEDFFVALKEFISYLLTITDHNDEPTVLISYALWQETQHESFNLNSLLSVMDEPVAQPVIEEPLPPPDNNILKEPDILLKENYVYDSSFIYKNIFIATIIIILFMANIILKLLSFYSMELFFVIFMAIIVFCIFYSSNVLRDAPQYRIYDKITNSLSEDDTFKPQQDIIKIDTTILTDSSSNIESQNDNSFETVLLCINPEVQHRFLVYSGIDFSQEVTLEKFPFNIGKDSSNDLVINSPTVSRVHARILYENGSYFIEDLNSTNGTKLNETAIASYTITEIAINDRITFADLTYIFQ